jgi:adenylate kinase family enzyme
MPENFVALQNRCLQLQLDPFAESPETLHTSVAGLAAALAPTDPGAAVACSLLTCLALLHVDAHSTAQTPAATRSGAGAGGSGSGAAAGGAPVHAASVVPPYLEDAAAELARYRAALEQVQSSPGAGAGDAAAATALFTPLYLLAASRIAQGRGQLKVQAAALSALKKWPEGKVASGSLLQKVLAADEEHLEGLVEAAERAAGGVGRAGATTHAGGPGTAAVALVHRHAGAAGLWAAKKADAAAAAAAAAAIAATTAAAATVTAAVGGAAAPGVVAMPDTPAIDELMALVGLESVKRSVLALYDRVVVSRMRGETGAPTDVPLNFRLVGNPGTGKTVVARLLARILAELGLRPGDEDAAAVTARQAAAQAASDAGLERQKHDLIKQAAQLGLAKAQVELTAARSALTAARTALRSVSDMAAQASQLDPVRGGMGHYSAVFDQLKLHAATQRSELERLISTHMATEAACLTAVDAATARLQAADTGAQTAATVANAAASAVPPAGPQRFVETSGGKLQQDGVAAFEATVQSLLSATPPGGVIFIDEAHQLVQSDTMGGGRDVVKRLIKYSEDNRDVLTFILAGYPKDIEALMEADEGLRRRFPEQAGNLLKFEDYSAGDLAAIFGSFLARLSKSCPHPGVSWTLANARDAEIVGRRIARGAGRKGFGNAGVVEGLIKGPIMSRNAARIIAARAAGRSLSPREMFTLTQADVLGCEPAPESSAAYRDLSAMVGLTRVKEAVRSLLLQMQAMWRDEQRGVTPQEVPRLNRLFLGPPGTGKTTVAKLYGQVLAECGFLSSGEVMVTQPSDFVGAVLGESERKTAQLLERAKGKILVIDEVGGAAAKAQMTAN